MVVHIDESCAPCVEICDTANLDSSRLFAPSEARTIYSAREVAELQYSDADEFLNRLGVSEDAHGYLRALVVAEGPHQAFLKIAFADIAGIPARDINEFFDLRPWAPKTLDYKHIEFAGGYCNYEVELDVNPGTVLQHPVRSQQHISLFPATFRITPQEAVREQQGVHASPHIFAMYLPQRDMQTIRSQLTDAEGDHVQSAFAYLRFYVSGAMFIVAELQSDFFGRLRSPELRGKYQHWAKELLLAFEDYALRQVDEPQLEAFLLEMKRVGIDADAALSEAQKGSYGLSAKVYLPTSKTIELRWPDVVIPEDKIKLYNQRDLRWRDGEGGKICIFPGVSPVLAATIYERLPKVMDYEKRAPQGDSEAFLLNFPEHDSEEREVAAESYWCKKLSLHGQENGKPGYIERFREHLSGPVEGKADRWCELYNELFPNKFYTEVWWRGLPDRHSTDKRIIVSGQPLTAAELTHFELAPARRIELREIPGMTDELIAVHSRALSRPEINQILDALPGGFTLFGKGRDLGAPSAWWELPKAQGPGWKAAALHPFPSATPRLRFIEYDESGSPLRMAAVIHNGCGIGDRRGAPLQLYNNYGSTQLPFYLRRLNSSGRERCPGDLVGGESRLTAALGFLNSLGALSLIEQAAPELHPAVAVPVDLSEISAFPVWNEGRTDWHLAQEYLREFFDGQILVGVNRPLSYRTLVNCDLTVDALASCLLGNIDPESWDAESGRQRLIDQMAFLYWCHGEKMIVPSQAFVRPLGPSLEERLYLLASIGEENVQAARRIRGTVEDRTVSLMALIHGAGGEFGGLTRFNDFDTYGSVLSPVSVDCCGVLHGIRRALNLPWLTQDIAQPLAEVPGARDLFEAQIWDAAFHSDTMYWLDAVLFGSCSASAGDAGISCHKPQIQDDRTITHSQYGTKFHNALREGQDNVRAMTAVISSAYGESELSERYREYYKRGREALK